MKKPTIFMTNIKSTHNFLHFHKDLRSRNFNNVTTVFFKKWKNYAFWWLILTNVERKNFKFFEFVKYGLKYFDSERSWYILAQITGSRTSYSRSEIFVKKYKIIRLFHILYKNGSFFHRSLLKTEIVKVNKWKIEN